MPKAYTPNDKWSQKAKREQFRARSVYKLKELDAKFHLLAPGMKVLDIGAAPGSWLQYTAQNIGPEGHVLGLDLQEIAPVGDNVTTGVCDITKPEEIQAILKVLGWEKVDLILSDIAPSTTGVAEVDQKRSVDLNRAIFAASKLFLKPSGNLVLKVFDGRDFQIFIKELKAHFRETTVHKPHASRDRSREVYVLCR